MKLYKGMNKDMKCLHGYQFEVGKTYETESAELCKEGFHACEFPLDCFAFYTPGNGSRYFEVELNATEEKNISDTKRVGTRISILRELSLSDLATCAASHILGRTDSIAKNGVVATNTKVHSMASNTGDRSVALNTGFQSMASNTGDRSVASNTGDWSVAANTGFYSMASNTGYKSVASNTGDWSVAANTGFQSVASNTGCKSVASNTGDCSVAANTGCGGIAVAVGAHSCASASLGGAICLCEYHSDSLTAIKAAIVDGTSIKADTLYTLINGEFVEVRE